MASEGRLLGGVVSTLSLYLSLSLVLFGNHLTAFNSSIDGNASYTWHGANFGLLCLSMKLLATLTSKSRASYLDMETFHYLPFTFYHATTPLSDAFLVSWFGPRCHIPAVDLSSRPPPLPNPSPGHPHSHTLTEEQKVRQLQDLNLCLALLAFYCEYWTTGILTGRTQQIARSQLVRVCRLNPEEEVRFR